MKKNESINFKRSWLQLIYDRCENVNSLANKHGRPEGMHEGIDVALFALDELYVSILKRSKENSSSEIEAMEKQPTEYEYEKVDLSSNDIALSMIGGEVLYDHDGTYKYSWNGSRFVNQEGSPICIKGYFYRRIELTPEQLHERKVEELAKKMYHDFEISEGNVTHPEWGNIMGTHRRVHKSNAKTALEWMESKGK